MKKSTVRVALGLFIAIASLAASQPASAQSYVRWRNASTPGNNLYFLGVAGGPNCNTSRGICILNPGTQMILWWYGQNDQLFSAYYPGGPEHVVDYFGDIQGYGYCLHPSGSNNNSNLVVTSCSTSSSDNWTIVSAASVGAGSAFPGCYIFQNQASGKVMSVYQGNVYAGARVVQYDFCQPGSNACGNPSNAFHADQFWCPQ